MHINLNDYKRKLLEFRSELVDQNESEKESTKTVELDQSRIGRLSRMDAMQSQQMAIEANRRRKIQLQKIDLALKRIENNTFGFCSQCDEEINPKRLEFDLTVSLCINCANGKI